MYTCCTQRRRCIKRLTTSKDWGLLQGVDVYVIYFIHIRLPTHYIIKTKGNCIGLEFLKCWNTNHICVFIPLELASSLFLILSDPLRPVSRLVQNTIIMASTEIDVPSSKSSHIFYITV